MKEISIPTEHIEKFKFYIGLPNELKSAVVEFLGNLPIGTSPNKIIEIGAETLTKLTKDRIADIVLIFLNLTRVKENLSLSIDEFLPVLERALKKSEILSPEDTELALNDFKKLLSNNSNTSTTAKLLDAMTENQKNFLNATIVEDIRTAFDSNENYLGSVIIHNLKIRFSESGNTNEVYFALDKDDVETLIKTLKKSQERVSKIKNEFKIDSIIEIK